MNPADRVVITQNPKRGSLQNIRLRRRTLTPVLCTDNGGFLLFEILDTKLSNSLEHYGLIRSTILGLEGGLTPAYFPRTTLYASTFP